MCLGAHVGGPAVVDVHVGAHVGSEWPDLVDVGERLKTPCLGGDCVEEVSMVAG